MDIAGDAQAVFRLIVLNGVATGDDAAYETYGLTPVFAAVEKHLDPVAGRLAAAGLDIPHYFLDDAGSAGTIIGALSRMQAVVSMRLHALIFAAESRETKKNRNPVLRTVLLWFCPAVSLLGGAPVKCGWTAVCGAHRLFFGAGTDRSPVL